MKRCLVLNCTQTKRNDEGLLPAFERYDGPTFRVVRRFLRLGDPSLQNVDIYVLSARYGLIPACQPISHYDQRMTRARALELRPQVLRELQALLGEGYYEVFVVLGQLYLQVINGIEKLVPPGVHFTVCRASAGRQLTELKRWLYQLPERTAPPRPKAVQVSGRAILRGRVIEATVEEVLELARQALAHRQGEPHNFHLWYTLIDGERVGTKWLVSLLSGLPVSAFQASEGRRVLEQLGIPVYQDG